MIPAVHCLSSIRQAIEIVNLIVDIIAKEVNDQMFLSIEYSIHNMHYKCIIDKIKKKCYIILIIICFMLINSAIIYDKLII